MCNILAASIFRTLRDKTKQYFCQVKPLMHIYIYAFHQTFWWESLVTGLIAVQPRPLTPRGRCGEPYHVIAQFFCYPFMANVRHSTNICPLFWRRLTCPSQVFINSYLWRLRGIALLRPGGGAWHIGLLLTTGTDVNCWADVANHVTQSWQAGDTEIFERRITGQLWAVSPSRATQSRDKMIYRYSINQ